ncbi:MAG TPA: hypothetical protein VNM24_11375 [Burkholderiales bacterium]|nr:hypothetical protein [Burkholderiales bacterium]
MSKFRDSEDGQGPVGNLGAEMLALLMLFNGTTFDRARGDVTNGLDVDVTRLPAGESHIGQVGAAKDIVDVTLTLDTVAYAAGDVLSDTATLANAMRVNGGKGMLRSITVIDEDDQGAPFDIYFFKVTQNLGTKNAAPTITDAAARDCLGVVSIAAADYKDLGGVRIATVRGVDLALESDAASRDIFIGTVTQGTPTHTANGLRLKFGIEQG